MQHLWTEYQRALIKNAGGLTPSTLPSLERKKTHASFQHFLQSASMTSGVGKARGDSKAATVGPSESASAARSFSTPAVNYTFNHPP